MDIRMMQYYLAVVREGTISAAAEALHVSQPALSRQMKDLEEELGVTLFQRGSRRITLTEEGMILRKRAEEMLRLMQLTETELTQARDTVSGEIHIGAGESHAFHFLSRAAGQLMQEHPGIRVHVVSGDTADLMDQLGNGLLDFALIFSEFDRSLYHSLVLPQEDRFGVLMRRDSELADKTEISIKAMDNEDLLRDLRKEGRSDSYVAKARGMLFQIMNKAEANELIRRNPVACAEKMRANKPMEAKEAFTADEVKRLMQELPHDKYGDSIRLMLGTGIRMQELLALEPRLIEEDGSVIHIRQAVKTVSGKVEIGPPKSRDSLRDVPIPEGMRPMVISLRDTEDTYIFQSPNKEQPFDPKHYRDKFKQYISDIDGVRVLTPHSCRHTYVSQMQALGVDLATIQSMVGHADLDMTQHYLHVQSPIKQKAVEAFNEAFLENHPHSSQIPVGP